MPHIPLQFIYGIRSPDKIFAYLVILPVCVLNILPFLSLLFPPSKIRKRMLLTAVICIDAALLALATHLTHQLIYSIKYDTWMHLAIIQRGVDHGLFAGDPYYPNYPTPPHYSLIDVLYIYASKITGVPPLLLWGNLSLLFTPLIFLACVWWHQELFDDLQLGWLAGFLFIVSLSMAWHYATYPRNFALIFFFLCLLCYFRSARHSRYILYCGLTFGLCIMSHLFTAIICLTFLIGYFLLACVIAVSHRKARFWADELKRFAFLPIGCTVASPWLFVFGKEALTHTETSVGQYSLPDWHVDTTLFGQTFTVYDPRRLLETFPTPLWILAGIGFLICLYRIVRGDHKPLHVFLVSSAIIPVVVLLTPLYSPIVRLFGEWMPSRFATVMPVPALAALTCGMTVSALSAMRTSHQRQALIIRSCGIVFAFAFMIAVISPVAAMQKRLYEGRDGILTPLFTWDDDFQALKGMIKDTVVLTDPTTSYFLTYYTGAYVVAIPPGHGSPYIDHEARNADVATMFDPNTSPAARYEMLNKYHVEYVMLNFRARSGPTASRDDSLRRRYLDLCRAMFDQQNGFKLVYDVNGVIVYKYDGPRSPG
jgi:hypothetical protein